MTSTPHHHLILRSFLFNVLLITLNTPEANHVQMTKLLPSYAILIACKNLKKRDKFFYNKQDFYQDEILKISSCKLKIKICNEEGKGRCENEADLSKFYINYFLNFVVLFALFFLCAVAEKFILQASHNKKIIFLIYYIACTV